MSDVQRAVDATNFAIKDREMPPLSFEQFRETFTLPMDTWLTGLGIPKEALQSTESRWNQAMQSPAPMRAGAAELLKSLKKAGIKLGVVTAANDEALQFDINAADLAGTFDYLHSAVTDKAQCLSNLKQEEGRYLYIGDTTYDIESARQAGYETIAISGGYQSDARLNSAAPDHLVSDFHDLEALINQVPAKN